MTEEIAERLKHIGPLKKGLHEPNGETCVMEAVAFVANEAWSDNPQCTSPVISTFLRVWNDALPDDEREALLRPLIPRLIGTRGSADLEKRRSLMATDWLVRTHAAAWLRLAGMIDHANALTALPEITDVAQLPSIHGPIEAAKRDAEAVWAASEDAAWHAAWAAAGEAAWAAARDADGDAFVDAVWDAAGVASGAAARIAAWAAMAQTRKDIQQSALSLVARMIEAREPSDVSCDKRDGT